ncbi:MAG: PAS domain-containing protein [Prevotellaceae bacterium]|jgi:nitrogen fixation/metabolism regulation signal transduction histidine kinase|nr:PAS domain-containing protein [Prevotellaceae bacterium]
MPIRFFFWLLVVMLLGVIGLLTHFSIAAGAFSVTFYIAESLSVFVLIYLIVFYHRLVRPMNTIANGMDLLREQDFSSRLKLIGQIEADRIVELFNRMIEQLKNERLRLREQNNFLDLLIDASPMGVLILSLDGRLTQCNPAALRILGVGIVEIVNRKLSDIPVPLAMELAKISRGTSQTVRLNDANVYKCTHSSFIDNSFPHSFFLLESLTDEVIKVERQAYEKVIRMIAHEVNNTTAGITSTLDSVNEILSESPDNADLCTLMSVCINRCYAMSRFITRFSDVVKIPEPNLVHTDINALLAGCMRFMESTCSEHNISLRLSTVELPEKKIDATLMEQAVLNIIKNSVESIGNDGDIVIRTDSPAMIEVADNGRGIDQATETKLFTPFFSTKPRGQGIGLLFIREVLTRHGCTFSLRTYPDGWTRFRILFP